jgi:hypothetical protein
VYGQCDDFELWGDNNPSLDLNGLSMPRSVAVHSDGVYVADGANRVLFFPRGSNFPTRVYGQVKNAKISVLF